MIEASHLSKRFKLYDNPADRLKESLLRRTYHRNHQALDDVSFRVEAGEALGIIGKNGAGKSTLLKIMTGVLMPDSGTIRTEGTLTGLLELGTGFDHQLTGLNNITANGLLIGMTIDEIAERRDAIIEFAELGEYIHEPLRTYSSGMIMRLAFAIAIHADPQCFLVDEALSVGDGHFQQKCMSRIRRFREGGGSLLFVSHDLNAVKMICDRAIVLDQGRVVAEGDPEYAVNCYNKIIAVLSEAERGRVTRAEEGFGDGSAKIEAVTLRGVDSGAEVVTSGEDVEVGIDIRAARDLGDISVGMMIRDRFGQDVFGTNSHLLEQSVPMAIDETCRARFGVRMDLAPGKYTITAALHSGENHIDQCYHWRDNVISFEVAGVRGSRFSGLCRLPTRFDVERTAPAEVKKDITG